MTLNQNRFSQQLRYLRLAYTLLTFFIISMLFYSISVKLPFDASMSNKKIGFFNLYLYFLTQSFSLWIPLIRLILTQIGLQISVALLTYFCIKKTVRVNKKIQDNLFLIGILFWLSVQACILFWNWYLYPYSFFSIWLNSWHLAFLNSFLLIFTSLLVLSIIIMAFIGLIRDKEIKLISILFLLVALAIFSLFDLKITQTIKSPPDFNRPNIIIVITDSLRPDFTDKKKSAEKSIPNFISEINNSVYFSNSFTTLGRSTPGLMTVISGLYPKNNGARFNLIDNKMLDQNETLPKILKQRGYETILAADSLQFININQDYGFDKIVAPKPNIYDFIFTYANDTPLSNLMMNTPVGKWLFPQNYANRASYYTYTPNSFVQLLKSNIKQHNPHKPLFLMIDLTLAHWPYVWSKQPSLTSLPERYIDAVQNLDIQYGKIVQILQNADLLQHAILITLSDHGDSLGLPGDRAIEEKTYVGEKNRLKLITQYPYSVATGEKEKLIGLDTSTGHGTDLLSLTQLQTTLSFQFFGINIPPKIVEEKVALIDVAPTLLDLLGIASKNRDGISLKPLMLNQSNFQLQRPIFIESEIEIPLIDITDQNKSHSVVKHLIDQYATLYTIDLDTSRLVLKPQAVRKLLREKQRGIIDGNWLLVNFPGKNNTQSFIINDSDPLLKQCYYTFPVQDEKNVLQKLKRYICYTASPSRSFYVLVNLKNKSWQIFYENEKEKNTVFNHLYLKLKKFYGSELG